ncbi:hypothetical protein ACFQ1I_31675 [Kitasatospora arboriphila]
MTAVPGLPLRQLLMSLGEPLVELQAAPAGLDVPVRDVAILDPEEPPAAAPASWCWRSASAAGPRCRWCARRAGAGPPRSPSSRKRAVSRTRCGRPRRRPGWRCCRCARRPAGSTSTGWPGC